jgi:hypothetical protein
MKTRYATNPEHPQLLVTRDMPFGKYKGGAVRSGTAANRPLEHTQTSASAAHTTTPTASRYFTSNP